MDERVPLYRKLEALQAEDFYPFHMPGHKRCGIEEFLHLIGSSDAEYFRSEFDRILQMDITEVEPFDDLNHPTGELKDAMDRCAKFYGAQETFFLVNGSTSGICAAIDAVCRPGDEILMARNSHISVYRQVLHGQLRPFYLYPQRIQTCEVSFYGAVTKEELLRGLSEHPNVKAVLVVSPTYDGIVSDIAVLARVAHEHGKILIVDEAHGAHLQYIRPELSAVHAGADLVIQSVHKTLPAMTQTALLHRCSERVDAQRLRDAVAYFTTTSPSYVLVAGMLRCMDFMEVYGEMAMRAFYVRLVGFYRKCRELSAVKLFAPFWPDDAQDQRFWNGWCKDPSKIVILCPKRGIEVAERLREAKIETESCSPDMVLALASVFDTEEGLKRLYEALAAIPKEAAGPNSGSPENADPFCVETFEPADESRAEQVLMPYEVYYQKAADSGAEMEYGKCALAEAEGRVSLDTVYVYPPGIPQIVCGEVISREMIDKLIAFEAAGSTLRGLSEKDQIRVLKK
ncbi:MAG: aminotransferase class V-fold PLP-dependent enzyme [Lachnospiraceae bacterium]|nr:aminotransferase class V-fold PLP-dependent enzyme [Lachnospiraceae bacterium]